jgi:hypothetical protein
MSREFWIVEVHPVEWEDPTGLFYYFASESKARRFVEYAEAKAGVVHATMWRDGTGTLTEARADLDGYDWSEGYEDQA